MRMCRIPNRDHLLVCGQYLLLKDTIFLACLILHEDGHACGTGVPSVGISASSNVSWWTDTFLEHHTTIQTLCSPYLLPSGIPK